MQYFLNIQITNWEAKERIRMKNSGDNRGINSIAKLKFINTYIKCKWLKRTN